jgi:hypothetical protein
MLDVARVFGNDLAFGRHHHTLGIQAHADRAMGEAGRDAVAIVVHMH